jgi:hypothetical protein
VDRIMRAVKAQQIVALVVLGMAWALAGCGGDSSSGQQQQQPTATTAQSSLSCVSTQTAKAGATLGGNQQAFDSAFGKSSNGAYIVQTCGNPSGLKVQLSVVFAPAAQMIQLSYVDSGAGSVAASHTITQSLMPSDTVYVGKGQGDSTTTVDIYRSATVGTAFPASDFTDINNNPVPRGTFNVSCNTLNGNCIISLGS